MGSTDNNEYKRRYRERHRKELAEKQRQYKIEHPDRVIESTAKCRKKHKEKRKQYQKEYDKTISGRASKLYRNYMRDDKKNNFDTANTITTEWIIENIFTSKCIYCGDSDWTHLGCDRIDNSKPHTADNVVCSCGICNVERADRYSVENFIQYRKLHPRLCDIKKAAVESRL